MEKSLWTVAEAKAKFSLVMEQAQKAGPQTITRHGRSAVILVSSEEWERRTARNGSLAEFFAKSPLVGSKLSVKRTKDRPRQIQL